MPNTEALSSSRKEKVGVVLSNKMQKTIVVETQRRALHPLYGKVISKSAKFKVHDEKNEARIGDKVRIRETRPLSKEKRWRLVEVLAPAAGASAGRPASTAGRPASTAGRHGRASAAEDIKEV